MCWVKVNSSRYLQQLMYESGCRWSVKFCTIRSAKFDNPIVIKKDEGVIEALIK
jgi:hypothetical protein